MGILSNWLHETNKELAREDRRKETEERFGPNPCTNLRFLDDDYEVHTTQCNRPRCPDCGPRKSSLLWTHLEDTFDPQVNLYAVETEDDYQRLVTRIRVHRHRTGESVEYASWRIDNTTRILITNLDLNGGSRVQLASLKKRATEAYQRGFARLRKSWNIGSVTLLRKSFTESVTGKLKWVRTLTQREERASLVEAERRAMVVEAGFDPDEWDTWEDEDGHIESTLTTWKVESPQNVW
jgi:hypothetical protein